jgi:hypothetical protein
MLLRIRKVTGAGCGAVGFGVFARVLREWWVGEKKNERAMQQGRAAVVARETSRSATCFAPRSPKDPVLS